ncbi:MAG: site-specific DNA-methyltransferase [Phycisphaerales bacterium]|nr:MAG: site-specific DNA-methyltransferase [Phycisphaerales bacterium]
MAPHATTEGERSETMPGGRLHSVDELVCHLPPELRLLDNPQTAIPRIAKDKKLTSELELAVQRLPTRHTLRLEDARSLGSLKCESVHLVVTSPPYWTLKKYNDTEGQLGNLADYEVFVKELSRVWKQCFNALVPGGRVICVVGDVCLSRRKNNGRHTVVPLHASIQEECRRIGYDNLAPIIWYKIANAAYEVENGSSFLGKPYEPNAVIKNDIEFILMQRKPGGYRKPSVAARVLSVIPEQMHREWFQQIWSSITGVSTREHPAPYPLELAERLVRMFSFVGDTVLDPFAGTGTTNLAAAKWGRNSVGFEIDPEYFSIAEKRMQEHTADLFGTTTVNSVRQSELAYSTGQPSSLQWRHVLQGG